jgi:hypothetical protein
MREEKIRRKLYERYSGALEKPATSTQLRLAGLAATYFPTS